METWLLYAIISVFTAGLHNFALKIAAERHYNVGLISSYSYLVAIIFSLWYFIFAGINFSMDTLYLLMFLAFLNGFLFLLSMFSRIEWLKSIDTVIFYPLYKMVWPVIVTVISFVYFNETLILKEILWIILGILVPLLLITKVENKRQKHQFKWVILILVTAILTAIATTATKQVMVNDLDIMTFVFFSSIFWFIFSQIAYRSLAKTEIKQNKKWIIKFSIISWIFHFLSFYVFTLALDWNLAIVFTINSFSILIPIILSIIFYKEHFSFKKWFVILLSILAIIMFI